VRIERLDVGGQVEPVVSPSWVATLQTYRRVAAEQDRVPDGGIRRPGRRLVYRLPGPRTISSASAMAAARRSEAATSSGCQPDALDARVRTMRDWPSTIVPSRQRACSVEGRRRHGHDLPADGEDPVELADALLEVAALDRRHRGEQQVADGVPRQARVAPRSPIREAVLEELAHQRLGIGEGAMQLRRSPTGGIAELLAQHAGRPAVVGDRDDAVRLLGDLLEAAQQRRQAGAAADRTIRGPRARNRFW
jgi:hypothetical protein